MHLVLGNLKRYTGQYGCGLYTFGRTGLTVAGDKAVFKNLVKRMLNTSQGFGRIIVLVMNMQITCADSLTDFGRDEIVIDKRFGCLRGKLHHHSRR